MEWTDLLGQWAYEIRDIRERKQDPALREEAIADLHRFVARLEGAAKQLVVSIYYEAYSLGEDESQTPDLEERLRYLKLATSCALVNGKAPPAARSEHQRAAQLRQANRLDEARDVLQRTLYLLPDAHQTLTFVVRELAEVERLLGRPLRALELADEFDELAGKYPVTALARGDIERVRGYAYIDLGMPDQAREWIETPWQRAEDEYAQDRSRSVGERLIGLREDYIHLLHAQGDGERAIDLIDGFLNDEEHYAFRVDERAALLLMQGASLIGREIEDPEEPRLGAERIREALQARLSPSRRFYAHIRLAEQALHDRRLDEASLELGLAATFESNPEAYFSIEDALRLATLQARLQLAGGATSEVLRAARERLQKAVDAFLELWGQMPEREGGIGYLLYSRRRDSVGALLRLSIALDGEEAGVLHGFEMLLEMQSRGTIARREGVRSVSVDELRRRLLADREHGILAYLPTRSVSHVFALDGAELIHAELPPSYEIERARRRYLAHLVGALRNLEDDRAWALERERKGARALAAALLPPRIVEKLSSWSSVTIAGGDSLDYVPFAWLPLGAEPYLGTQLALDYLHSLPLGAAWAGRARARTDLDYVLVGGSLPSQSVQEEWPELVPIPLEEEWLADLRGSFDVGRSVILDAEAATLAELRRVDPGRASVLQFLVHGVRESGRERPMALVLTPGPEDDGLLRYADAAASRAPSFVVLTGCRTGQGPVRKGDPGIGTLSGAWLSAGSQAVLQAQTDLSLAQARRSSRTIYGSLKRGAAPAEALRRARVELVSTHGPEAPFRDGLLQITGLGQRPVFEAKTPEKRSLSPWWAGAVGLLLGVLLTRRQAK